MRLLAKTSLIYILSTAIVFMIGGLIFYYNLRSIVDEEATEHIYLEKTLIEKYAHEHDTIPVTTLMSGDYISITPADSKTQEFLIDTNIYNSEEEELLPYRQLTFPVSVDGKFYTAKVSKALFESDDLVETILFSFIILTLVLLAVTLLVNRIVSKKLWKPFFSSVRLLNDYQIDKNATLKFENTSTSEFKELNAALSKMTEKIAADYNNLKAFTENASHELQTPLSVIMLSTENLLQQENLNEKQIESIQTIHQTARKLSKLNQTLLLLAKIENRQFEERENVNLGEMVESRLDSYSELIAHKEITLNKNISKGVVLKIHPVLAEVMISNLLTNAIRHNLKGGIITLQLNHEKLMICNSGNPLQGSDEKLFERFYKENISTESTGLGLSLVKQVANTNGMKVSYSYKEKLHCFEILLPLRH